MDPTPQQKGIKEIGKDQSSEESIFPGDSPAVM